MTGKQLKNSILQWAIQGKLVPQDPNDEPASVLLEKIRAEKARQVKEGKLKKKDLEVKPIAEDEIPFEIPKNWEWVRLKSLVSVLGDGIHGTPEYDSKGGYFFINGNNLSKNKIVLKADTKRVNEIEYQKYKKELSVRTILVSINGTIGNVGYYNGEPVILGKSACYFNLINTELKDYITFLMYTDYFLKYAIENATGSTIKNVSLAVMNDFLLPLPPLAEQHRIVAKIEELMPLVEKYGETQETLEKWNNSLPEKLKKSILQEAIQGKLVPQDPADEPASALLERIRQEKQRLVKEGKLKKKDLEVKPIEEDEIPFEIPESWEWVKLGELVGLFGGTSYQKNDIVKEGIRILRGGNILKNEVCLFDDDVFLPHSFSQQEINIKVGDILIVASTGSKTVIGKPAFVRKEYPNTQIGAFLRIIRPLFSCYNDYLRIIFASEYYRNHIRDEVKGIGINNVRTEYLTEMVIPLPPLAEQRRIVAKIEELFGLLNAKP